MNMILYCTCVLALNSIDNLYLCKSCLGSIDNLYKNIFFNPFKHFKSQNLMGKFVKSRNECGFVKKPSFYMVTDDLVVTPGSSICVVLFLTKSGVSSSDLDEQIIRIGKRECLSLLKASLISSLALTNVLGQLIFSIKNEKITN
ncbi:hypothetical protein Lal_00020844 [Lupinus albus]|uniref:Uncharacterized protein n=1 Tax=Lupinus albus TaxID=3870 RepID=A0A6A4Q4H0_LUPAL|nr:hypothetical protein Lalb_Chr08g0237341 [Lupinus albus]KAF1871110.1 hypothetical protein Lal_00020844 [Lupinus albus]